MRGGSSRIRVGSAGQAHYRVVNADRTKLLLSVRWGVGDDELVLGMRLNLIAVRMGVAAKQAGLGEGYSEDSSRLGIIKNMETLGVHLLRGYAADSVR